MNKILSFILEFIGLAKKSWHYTHDTPSQHILDYFARIDPYKITGLAIVPKDDPSRTGTIEPSGHFRSVDGLVAYYELGGKPRLEPSRRPPYTKDEIKKGYGRKYKSDLAKRRSKDLKGGGDTGER